MRIYIAGPMSLYKATDWGWSNFQNAYNRLKGDGHTPVSPHKIDGAVWDFYGEGELDTAMDRKTILAIDIEVLRTCDAIYMLRDWDKSTGAILELAYAQTTGMKVMFEDGAVEGRVGLVK